MAENKILPWAQSSDANVFSDDEYATDVATGGIYVGGVQTGLASSKQANKTWRQATAPGSGLGQFLVDNLSVDVTDADTPSTFSTRIANAVLKLAQISPFNQSWAAATGGYRKYAIVSDSSGNYWVSTADQNTTVPGANGANWQSLFNGYATQSWANGEFATITQLQSEAAARAAAVAGRVQRVNFIRFNASGTYVASPNLLFAKIVAKGGGGGAGGMVGGGSGRASGGGGEGATSTTWYTAEQIVQSNGHVVVGAGGAGGVGAASGGVGGVSYVFGLHQAAGGQPSQGLSSGPLGTHGGAGGYNGSTGSVTAAGAPGGGGISSNTAYLCAGSGGGSGGGFGIGVFGTTYADGVSGMDNTGGGGGGCVSINGTATGGSGGSGYVEITEYIGG